MKHTKKQDQKIDSGDSMSQKTNEDFNKKKPIGTDPGFKKPLPIPQAPIIEAMKDMEKEPPNK